MSVYCKNCVHLVPKYDYSVSYLCGKDCVWGKDYLGNKVLKGECYAEPKNKNNDCPDYKRKWWKFWIKDEVKCAESTAVQT